MFSIINLKMASENRAETCSWFYVINIHTSSTLYLCQTSINRIPIYLWKHNGDDKPYDSKCVSASFLIQHAKRTLRTVLSSVACPAVPHFSTLSHKRQDFKEKLLYIICVCVLTFSTNFVCSISNSKKKWARHYHKCMYIFVGRVAQSV